MHTTQVIRALLLSPLSLTKCFITPHLNFTSRENMVCSFLPLSTYIDSPLPKPLNLTQQCF